MGMHVGRHWPNTYRAEARGADTLHPTIESECPCPREPCGLIDVEKISIDCDQHHGGHRTLRSSHAAEDCPGAPTEV